MIRWQLTDRIATLTLDRGSARNAVPISAWEALATAADEIRRSHARAAMLSSTMPGVFSAGADLAEFRQLIDAPALRGRFRAAMAAAIEGIAALPMPVIAAVDGGCFGAAVALTLACDIVVAGDAAVFATTPAKLGLTYPARDVARLAARVGEGNAAMMLFGGGSMDADAAFRIGLVQQRSNHALASANALAAQIVTNAPGAVRGLKRVLRDPADQGHPQAFEDAFGSDDFRARLDAFLARGK